MAIKQQRITQAIETTNVADLLERVLDKGVVISGDIKVKLVDVELLTVQIRLVICSVDKAREIGLDWWSRDPTFSGHNPSTTVEADDQLRASLDTLNQRLARLEQRLGTESSES